MTTLPATYVKGFHDEKSCMKMKYRPFGKTGLHVSEISLGGGTFSKLYGELDEEEAIATIHEAIKSGINYIDTAPWYGQGKSEEIIGKALKDIPREAYYIATKIGRYELDPQKMFNFSAEKTRESFEKSLELLGLDYVDIIQIHDIEFADNLDDIINGALPELEAIIKEGKAKFIGVTGYPLKTLKEFILSAPQRVDTVLSYARHTLFDKSFQEYLPFFIDQNLGIVCASGHGLGLLTNAGHQDWHPASDDIKFVCRKAAAQCKDDGVELAKLAMYYFVNLEGPSTFLSGMQTRKLLKTNLSVYFDGLAKKEQEMLKYLQETLFTTSVNWEGIEVEIYRDQIKKKKSS